MIADRTLSSTLNRMFTINHALDQALAGGWSRPAGRVYAPALDIIERSDAYLISLELPGVDQKDIELSFEQNVLTVRGAKPATRESASAGGELRVYADERLSGTFECSIRLPEFVDGSRIAAELTHGVLNVTVPKAQAAQARKIEIRAADQSNDRIQPPSTAKD